MCRSIHAEGFKSSRISTVCLALDDLESGQSVCDEVVYHFPAQNAQNREDFFRASSNTHDGGALSEFVPAYPYRAIGEDCSAKHTILVIKMPANIAHNTLAMHLARLLR